MVTENKDEEQLNNSQPEDNLPAEEPGSTPENAEIPVPEGEHFRIDAEAPTATAEQLLAEEKDKYLRLYSEFDNFRRRSSKERIELMQTAGKDVIVQLLGVMDDFERALTLTANLESTAKASLEGMELIYKKLSSILEARGLKPIEAKGKPFDVEFHEAITRFPAPSEDQKGLVIDEVEKGYTLNGHVIRFAKVVVGE
jgi:molecular chaperone GrpE